MGLKVLRQKPFLCWKARGQGSLSRACVATPIHDTDGQSSVSNLPTCNTCSPHVFDSTSKFDITIWFGQKYMQLRGLMSQALSCQAKCSGTVMQDLTLLRLKDNEPHDLISLNPAWYT
jgi:hypothetical protein